LGIIADKWRALFSGTQWLLIERILRITLNQLLAGFVSMAYLSKADIGILGYVHTFILLAQPLTGIGIDNIVIRELARPDAERDKIIATGFYIKLVGSIIVYAFIVISFLWLQQDNPYITQLMALVGVSVILSSSHILQYFFQAVRRFKEMSIVNMAANIVTSLLRLFFVLNNYALMWIGLSIVAEFLVCAVGYFYAYNKLGYRFPYLHFDLALAKKYIQQGYPLVLSGWSFLVFQRIDQVFIERMLTHEDLGDYNFIVKIAETVNFFSTQIMMAFTTHLIIAKSERNDKRYQTLGRQFYGAMLFAGFGAMIALQIIYPPFVIWFKSGKFANTIWLFELYAVSILFTFLMVAFSRMTIIEELEKYNSLHITIGAVLNIIFNLWWIPKYGLMGAVGATLISYGYAGVLGGFVTKKTRPIAKLTYLSFFFYIKEFFIHLRKKMTSSPKNNI
jgi:O-antigen/teichoic acid export membrane protein